MSKRAEEAAMKAFPDKGKTKCITAFGTFEIDNNKPAREGFILGYEQAEKDLGWISVKDRLPKKDIVVLTCWDVNGVPQGIGLRLYDGQWQDFDEDDDIEIADPDYWMPIPQFNK